MVSSRTVRRLLAPIGAIVWMLTVSGSAVLADEAASCNVEVSPPAATSGSVFVFSGTGFQPTELILQKEEGEPATHQLSVGDTDPWEVTVRSRVGDEGEWTATFLDPSGDCTTMVGFRVTLTSTDVLDDVAAVTRQLPAPVLLYALVVIVGFSGGVAIGRRLNSRSAA